MSVHICEKCYDSLWSTVEDVFYRVDDQYAMWTVQSLLNTAAFTKKGNFRPKSLCLLCEYRGSVPVKKTTKSS